LSLGAHLAPRAASAEHRLAACIADCGAYDLYGAFLERLPGALARPFASGRPWARNAVAKLLRLLAGKPTAGWAVRRGLLVHGVDKPLDFVDALRDYTLAERAPDIPVEQTDCRIGIHLNGQRPIKRRRLAQGDLRRTIDERRDQPTRVAAVPTLRRPAKALRDDDLRHPPQEYSQRSAQPPASPDTADEPFPNHATSSEDTRLECRTTCERGRSDRLLLPRNVAASYRARLDRSKSSGSSAVDGERLDLHERVTAATVELEHGAVDPSGNDDREPVAGDARGRCLRMPAAVGGTNSR
jgi:hypothetical protein